MGLPGEAVKSKDELVEEGAALLKDLIDWEGNDLKRIYEPIADQVSYIFVAVLVFAFGYFAWAKFREWKSKQVTTHVPYRVIKPPSTVIAEQGKTNKRICAVIGGTGFVGSHVVNELVKRGDYYVYVLGRTFRPERTNPNADCLIQVDLLDLDGLVSAFQGVDSVINTAAIVPTVFMSAEEIWLKNKNGQENVLEAAKTAGVKNHVFLSAMHPKNKICSREMKAFMNIFYRSEDSFVKANGKDGLRTCAIGPGNIIGINSPFIDMLLSGKMTSSPMNDLLPVSFAPAEYVAKALVNAEIKLAAGDEAISGKIIKLRGEVMTWRKFFNLSSWPKKISETPSWVLTPLIRINMLCAAVFNKAPFGPDLSAALTDIMAFVEEDLEDIEIQKAYQDLDVGPPVPPMEAYVRELVERYKEKKKDK
ncbi:sterol-4-alpha-carboxylate 3-dehydrogenase, decarboxylating-like [Halichondria panicea]|uniref:sterol-4-alpha-carboxylate 3-dehydrogenase, decarboxylating-like n=1 Tax=Halichondria panicea TaxID=6063 RepID=UPI00312B96B3